MDNSATTWRTVIVESQPLFRELLAKVLSLDARFSIVASLEDAQQATEFCRTTWPDLVIVEPDLPASGGIKLIEEVVRKVPGAKVLALSQCTEAWMITRLWEIGIQGFVEKNESLEVLLEAAVEVASGRKYFTASFFKVQEQVRLEPNAGSFRLTDTEQKILRLVVSGLTSRAIAERLNLTVRSVESYRYRMMRKLGIEGTVGLIKFALQFPFAEETCSPPPITAPVPPVPAVPEPVHA
jgi:DNA-binding NarL/FixJ family response regulator